MAKKKLLPKRVAGIKIPKKIRRGALGAFITSSAGQKLIAESLLVAGAAIAGKEAVDHTQPGRNLRGALKDLKETATFKGEEIKDVAGGASERLNYAFTEAARAFREALTTPTNARREDWTATAPDLDPAEGAKKKRSPQGPAPDLTSH